MTTNKFFDAGHETKFLLKFYSTNHVQAVIRRNFTFHSGETECFIDSGCSFSMPESFGLPTRMIANQ